MIKKIVRYLAVSIVLGVALAATYWSYIHGVILAYGDAEAHINISKRVVDSLTPGLAQLGGVWLPLPHVLMIPFVANNFLWRTGLAGSIVSELAFIWLAFILYRFAYLITKRPYISFIAPLVLLTNFNALYLATTPMTEILLLSLLSSSMYFFFKWIRTQEIMMLIFAAFFSCAASLTRYDGWFLAAIQILVVAYMTFIRTKSFTKVQGKIILFGFISFLGIVLWFFWNKLIFNDFLYFLTSEYSSKAQQMWFYARGYLPTYKNLPLSLKYYLADSVIVLGFVVTGIMITGLTAYILASFRQKRLASHLSLLLLLFPIFFYTLSLYLGQASIFLPVFAKPSQQWTLSNVRYGIQMILPAAIFAAYLTSRLKKFGVVIFILVILQGIYFYKTADVIAYKDGVYGLSSQTVSKGPDAPPAERWLLGHYKGGLVLMDDYRRPISPISSGIPMNKFIGVGNRPYWRDSLRDPRSWDTWIVLQKADIDPVWLYINKKVLARNYTLAYRSGNIWIYKVKKAKKDFVQRYGKTLTINDKPFRFRGVNIYDLLAMSTQDRRKLLEYAAHNHLGVIRFWAFNKEGLLTAGDFKRFDESLVGAKKNHLKLIPVFANEWSDWGGLQAFYKGKNADFFYTDTTAKKNYQRYLNSIVGHINGVNKMLYKNDPTILAWDLMNEPRIDKDTSGKGVLNWTKEMASYIVAQDENHLITVGTEGFLRGGGKDSYHEDHGAYLQDICSLPLIDLCSGHLYPKYVKGSLSESNISRVISTWQRISSENNKPLFIGEVGFDLSASKQKDKYAERDNFFKNVKNSTTSKSVTGINLWDMTIKPSDTFNLSINDAKDQKNLTTWAK